MNETNRVTIPNDVADAIESFRKDGHDNAYIMYHAARIVKDNNAYGTERITVLARKIPFDTLMAALINGYKREQTEEERAHEEVRRKYDSHRSDRIIAAMAGSPIAAEHRAYAAGIKFAVDTLGVKVAGVNA